MDRSLIKLYLTVLVAVVLIVLFAPVILGHTALWSTDMWTRTELAMAQHELPLPVVSASEGKAVFVMDDGWEIQYTAGFPLLNEYGMKGSIAVIPAAVGMDEYMSYPQLAELYQNGWDMLNHTCNHEDLTALSEEDQQKQMEQARTWLTGHGLKRGADVLVFPGGMFDSGTTETMSGLGYRAGRSLKSLWLVSEDCAIENVEICNLISGMTFDTMKRAADKAMNNGSTVIFVLHRIETVSDTSGMQIEEETLRRLLDYISRNKDKLCVVTMTQLLDTL